MLKDRTQVGFKWDGIAIAVVAICLGLSSCTGESRSTSTTATPAKAMTTTTVPPPPPLALTGEDWTSIVSSITAYENYLFQHPDPQQVDLFIDPACSCYQDTVDKLTGLRDRKWYVDGDDASVISVEFASRPDPKVVALHVTVRSNNRPIVDELGEVQEPGIEAPLLRHAYVLTLQDNGRWRLANRTFLADSQAG